MKFSLVSLIALALANTSVMALPGPAGRRALEKRDNNAIVLLDGLHYRDCPHLSCTSEGTYAEGTRIELVCFTRDDTDVIEGDPGWGLLANSYWVAIAGNRYVNWVGSLPDCRLSA